MDAVLKARLVIFSLVVAVFGIGVFGGFIQDDRVIIKNHPGMGDWNMLVSSWTEPYFPGDKKAGAYRPFTSLSYFLNSKITGMSASGFRLGNILIYSALCLLVFELALVISRDAHFSFWVGAVFAVLPIHTEAVANIVGRAELLSGVFVLLSIIFALKDKWGWAQGMFLLALFSKESAIVWAFPLLALSWKEPRERRISRFLMLVLILFAYFLMRFGVLGEYVFSNNSTIVENPLRYMPVLDRMAGAIGLFAFGVSKTLFPLVLSYDYSFNQIPLVGGFWAYFLCGILLLTGLMVTLVLKRGGGTVWWGALLLLLPFLVTGNLLMPIGTIFGERLWLLPSLGVLLLVMSFVWFRYGKKYKKMVVGFFALIVLVFGARSFLRNIDWLSERNLFVADGMRITGSVMTQTNYSAILMMDDRYYEAKVVMDRAFLIYPDYPILRNNLGLYFLKNKDLARARENFERCLVVKPGDGLCSSNLRLLEQIEETSVK